MEYQQAFNRLRDVLADLYPEAKRTKAVIESAGIPTQSVDLDGPAWTFWTDILTAAQNSGQMPHLLAIVAKEFSKNAELVEAIRQFEAAPTPPVPEGPDAAIPQPDAGKAATEYGGSNITMSVGRDNRGVMAAGDLKNANVVNTGDITGDGNVVGVGIESQVTIGGVPAEDESPSLERFQSMIQELQAELANLAEDPALAQVKPSAPSTAQGALQDVTAVAGELNGNPEQIDGGSITDNLTSAADLMEGILDRTKRLANKAGGAVRALEPLMEQMGPIVAKLALAVAWAGQLWPYA